MNVGPCCSGGLVAGEGERLPSSCPSGPTPARYSCPLGEALHGMLVGQFQFNALLEGRHLRTELVPAVPQTISPPWLTKSFSLEQLTSR